MEEMFSINESPYNLRRVTFTRNKLNTAAYGPDTMSFRCQEVWNSIPAEITSGPNINILKASLKYLSAISCSCRICKPFIGQIGYIQLSPKLLIPLLYIGYIESIYLKPSSHDIYSFKCLLLCFIQPLTAFLRNFSHNKLGPQIDDTKYSVEFSCFSS